MGSYKLLEHTADLGIRVWGRDLKSLFINSASAMFELIAGIDSIKPANAVEITADAADRDELLKNWLSELLYHFHVKETLFSRFEIRELDDNSVISVARGEKIDKDRHKLKREIKAVTFHGLDIHRQENILSTDIIFDV